MSDSLDDDLARAYERASALRDGEAGPAASVRANVLAAAQAVAAAQAAQATASAPPITPVAAPVADVGSGRGDAPNLSSWRIRSGAALAALLIVGFGLWRFDATHRAGGVQIAQADSTIEAKTLQEPAPPLGEPRELPPPRQSLPPPPAYAPPAVVADAAEPTVVLVPPALPAREHEKDTLVAQADTAAAARAPALGYRPPSAMSPAPLAAPAPMLASAPAPKTQIAMASPSPAPAPALAEPAPVLAAAAAAAPRFPPITLEGRIANADVAAPAQRLGFSAPASAAAFGASAVTDAYGYGRLPETGEQVAVTGARARPSGTTIAGLSGGAADAKKSASPAMASAMGEPPRSPGSSLHAAAGAGDLDALRRLLADPATRVDAPDGLGRSALMVAVVSRHAGAVRLLLAAGADPDRADASGASPRSVARTGPSAEIAALLGIVR